MPKFYCANCGSEFSSVQALTSCSCYRHPLGANKGKHFLYEGSEKSKYTCKYCGQQYSSIRSMTSSVCYRHPLGPNDTGLRVA
jgi:predicted nucleic acid-binding Zn ribbon protein